jgi:predicted unusual protein kinase regulating ubiquinone biosynthesis (AarF/ABC1/UbiB family)
MALALEFFTVFRPGWTQSIRRELRDTLIEELDFVREARHQDGFRRAARKSGKNFFGAPRVHFALSGDDVIVQEFVSGMWLWELVAAVEQGNTHVLALAARLNIDPGKVARRLAWVSFWSWHEHLFFIADPHADKIILGEGGTLMFIDFSSTSGIDRSKRRALQQNMYFAWKRDPLNMARASLTLLEPLPPVDVIEVTKELEAHNWQLLYALEGTETLRPWYERTMARQWSGLIEVARRFDMTIDVHVLRIIKSTLMFESLAARLDGSIDFVRQYRRFARNRASRAAERATRRVGQRAGTVLDKTVYLRLEQLASTGEGLFYRLRHTLTLPRVNFNSMMSKWSYTFVTFAKMITQLLLLTAFAIYAAVIARYFAGGVRVPYATAVGDVMSSRVFIALVIVLLFINLRAVLFRLDDRDVTQ